MVRVKTRQANGKECIKVLIEILFKVFTSLAKVLQWFTRVIKQGNQIIEKELKTIKPEVCACTM